MSPNYKYAKNYLALFFVDTSVQQTDALQCY